MSVPPPESPPPPRVDAAGLATLRADLAGAGYTVDGVRAVLGPVADAALHREQPLAAELVTAGSGTRPPSWRVASRSVCRSLPPTSTAPFPA